MLSEIIIGPMPPELDPRPGGTAKFLPPAATRPPQQAAPAGREAYRIQLAALRSAEQAEQAWKRLQQKHPASQAKQQFIYLKP